MEACPILVTDLAMEAYFDSRENLEREKLGTNFYLQFQILVRKPLHHVIDTPKRDCLFVLLEDKQNGMFSSSEVSWSKVMIMEHLGA
ncbi:hypothetical protein DY000_02059597 [Brassica cretica]|uniref:Uncharacterized protein n=1 Tax=Brassica cretica TaxID=69181 RepID=A0ABQ7ART8_BRACR|nr:hypothetical protein DY000_02059597 [Brassica cretica]